MNFVPDEKLKMKKKPLRQIVDPPSPSSIAVAFFPFLSSSSLWMHSLPIVGA
jgi:hypothetical protein